MVGRNKAGSIYHRLNTDLFLDLSKHTQVNFDDLIMVSINVL